MGSQGERTGQRERGGKTVESQLLRTPINSPSTAAIVRSGLGVSAALGRDAGLWKKKRDQTGSRGARERGTARHAHKGRVTHSAPSGLFEHRCGHGTSGGPNLPREIWTPEQGFPPRRRNDMGPAPPRAGAVPGKKKNGAHWRPFPTLLPLADPGPLLARGSSRSWSIPSSDGSEKAYEGGTYSIYLLGEK